VDAAYKHKTSGVRADAESATRTDKKQLAAEAENWTQTIGLLSRLLELKSER
jgi:hypothetical protein